MLYILVFYFQGFFISVGRYEYEKKIFERINIDMNDADATLALYQLSSILYRYYGKRVIILLDEYDTPMQAAYVNGFYDEWEYFTKSLFISNFKANLWLDKSATWLEKEQKKLFLFFRKKI